MLTTELLARAAHLTGAALHRSRDTAEYDVLDIQRLAHDAQAKMQVTLDCSRPAVPPKNRKERVFLFGGVMIVAGALWTRKRAETW
jgi:hypothetical protein|eukprot:COSAG01_NODE_11336_length_1955_cov_1.317349_2_plen_86_part_00